jgi:teichuronic acid exporter
LVNALRNKTTSGIFWAFFQRIGASGINFLVLILLARLLNPKDFGLIAMLMIFVQISQALIDGGFNTALIQKKDTDEDDYSTVFYINLTVSILLYTLLFFLSPFIAKFFNQPILTLLTRVLTLVFIINAFSTVQEARLMKEIRFKTLAFVHIPSTVIGGISGILMALSGFGVWSLIIMNLITRIAYVIQIWTYSKWKPLLRFKRAKAKKLFSFGGKLLVSNILTTIYNNVFIVIIGKIFPIADLGYYQNAQNLSMAPVNSLTAVLYSVTFPIFSIIQDDNSRLKAGYQRLMKQCFFLICPLCTLAAVAAYPLFHQIFGEKWLPAVPYFRWLCLVAILYPLNVLKLSIANTKGRSDIFLLAEVVRRIFFTVIIIFIILLFPGSIEALLIAQVAEYVFMFILFGHICGRLIQYSLWEQLRDIFPVLILSLILGVVAFIIIRYTSFLTEMLQLLIVFISGIILYCGIAKVLNFQPYIDLKELFSEKIKELRLKVRINRAS